jgi:arsenate reductase
VHPFALKTLQRRCTCRPTACAARTGRPSPSPGAPRLDFVFTVCDKAAGEACPVWPGPADDGALGRGRSGRLRRHGRPEGQQAFWDTAIILKRRIELMLALPLASLDRWPWREIRNIGSR